jgi:hypothetical protein
MSTSMKDRIAALEQQHAEDERLLAACEAALPAMEKALSIRRAMIGPVDGGISRTVEMLRAAIETAKGGA